MYFRAILPWFIYFIWWIYVNFLTSDSFIFTWFLRFVNRFFSYDSFLYIWLIYLKKCNLFLYKWVIYCHLWCSSFAVHVVARRKSYDHMWCDFPVSKPDTKRSRDEAAFSRLLSIMSCRWEPKRLPALCAVCVSQLFNLFSLG